MPSPRNSRAENLPEDSSGVVLDTTPLHCRLTDAFLRNGFANLLVVLALIIGFFHGWLKLRFRSPITTFAFDIPLVLATILVLARSRSLQNFFPHCRTTRPIIIFYGVAVAWLFLGQILPWGAPFIAGLAALRGWCFASLMLGLGYQLIDSRRQLHSYLFITIVLAALTGLYSTQQTEAEVLALRALDPYFERMTRGQAFVDDEGRWVLRRFSTFISSGAFGGTMAVCLTFAGALLSDPRVRRLEKTILILLSLFAGWGLFLSGARSALFALAIGIGIIVWFRRLPPALLVLLGICGVALYLGAKTTSGGILDRYSSLTGLNVFGRLVIVVVPGFAHLVESGFVGGGLGKAMVGLPQFLVQRIGYYEVWGVDGDLGKAMAELGVVGLFVLCWVLTNALRDSFDIMRRHRHSYAGTMGLAALVIFVNAVIGFPTGSPFISIPLGVLTWFFLGGALKLDRLATTGEDPYDRHDSRPSSPTSKPRPAPAPGPSAPPPGSPKNFMYASRKGQTPGMHPTPRPGKPSGGPPAPSLPTPAALPAPPISGPPPPPPAPLPPRVVPPTPRPRRESKLEKPPRSRRRPFLY